MLRIEKGHVTHDEINGTVTPDDLGFGKMVSTTKPDFIGKAMLGREALPPRIGSSWSASCRSTPGATFRAGSHILRKGDAATLKTTRVMSRRCAIRRMSARQLAWRWSRRDGSGMGKRSKSGTACRTSSTSGRLCDPVFFDKESAKLHG